jgi:hypothetical protein
MRQALRVEMQYPPVVVKRGGKVYGRADIITMSYMFILTTIGEFRAFT